MGKLMIADQRWLDNLESQNISKEDEVNFWSTKNSSLEEGDYFLLTSGREDGNCKIEAIAQFVRNEDLPVDEAWESFNQLNGAVNYEEFKQMVSEVINVNNGLITCTVLNNYTPIEQSEGKSLTYKIPGTGKLRASGIFISKR
ncbi:hypothetical protein LCM20_16670 [Halobacillus litoralis]|uniref:hypothetical protein n=1 Tax=Halobacillus litoralis TaxID=45668 RepID=UPI001CD4186B|nr:hypothetical protein [Halobacillus litoralis]MCA0972244.1 hypothetical protein [Halobacillus litoralis]